MACYLSYLVILSSKTLYEVKNIIAHFEEKRFGTC